MKIQKVSAKEVLDSRGNPTVEAMVQLDNGLEAMASVPSGASTGSHEAIELRDGDKSRYLGLGVKKAVNHVNHQINELLAGVTVDDQEKIDRLMIEADATENKSKLGANAILAVSMATCRAAAGAAGLSLYEYINHLCGRQDEDFILPVPMINVLNGGKHATQSTDLQEYMLFPLGCSSMAEAVRRGSEIYHYLGEVIKSRGFGTTVGDEGGFAIPLNSNEEPFKLFDEAVAKAGYQPGKEVGYGIDAAASSFYEQGKYILKCEGKILNTDELIEMYVAWADKYPIVSMEDMFFEDDWEGFRKLNQRIGKKVQTVGDDLYVTNTTRLKRGIDEGTTNSILIKVNQIGRVSETLAAIKMAQEAGWTAVVSHRSGETEDTFIADLVVGTGTGQIKTGSMSRSERIAKYNRLMRIEKELGDRAKMSSWPDRV